MDIIIREMQKGEEELVRKIGRPSFGIVEQLMFPKPKNALVAVFGDEIVGATTYRIFTAKDNQKVGYVETAYVKKGYQGKGVGNRLYNEVTDFLKNQGCDTVTAIVRDDNIASWKLFAKNDYNIISFYQMLSIYGIFGAVCVWFESVLAIATGHHMWATVPYKKESETHQFIIYILISIFVLIPILFRGISLLDFVIGVAAVLTILAVPLLYGKIMLLFAKGKWEFRVVRGGILTSIIVSVLGGVLPVVGRFYPEEYEDTVTFKRIMGMEALVEWAVVLVIVIMGVLLKGDSVFWKSIVSIGTSMLVYRTIPIYPFECFGGRRLWEYNKVLSLFVLGVSIALLYIF